MALAFIIGLLFWIEGGEPTKQPLEFNKENLSKVLNHAGKNLKRVNSIPKRI